MFIYLTIVINFSKGIAKTNKRGHQNKKLNVFNDELIIILMYYVRHGNEFKQTTEET